jgi:cyclase
MLTRRIIPCLDVKEGRVVKGINFENIKDVNDPVTLGKKYSEIGADELVFYDITASSDKRQISLEFVNNVAKEINIPFCVGGGVNTIEDIERILKKGADKVSINSGAIKNPSLITEGAKRYGSQCIVLSIDVKQVNNEYIVFINGGRINTNMNALEWAKKGVELGAGELVINSMDKDGMKDGFDIKLLQKLEQLVSVPIIASGGAGSIQDFIDLGTETTVDGYLAASVFHYNEIEIKELKEQLQKNNIPVRI